MKRLSTLGVLVLSLSGCATVSDLPQGYRLDVQGTEGLVVVSLTLSGMDLGRVEALEFRVRPVLSDKDDAAAQRRPTFSSVRQYLQWMLDPNRPTPSGVPWKLIVKDQTLAEPLDIVEAGTPIGRVAALPLPAGEYELYDWGLRQPNQYGGNEFSPKQAFVYRFKVKGGHATYVGNVDLQATGADTFKMTVKDKAQRDLTLFAKKVPGVNVVDTVDTGRERE